MALTPEKADLLGRIEDGLRLSGWRIIWLNDDHPARARLIRGDARIDGWIHIWNLTSGGRPASRPLERRIQPTGIGDQFRASPGMRTLILGWSQEASVFAAFDYRYHSGQLGNSPSIQTDLPALEAASAHGLGVYAKSTGELSIAVRADMLGIYFEQMQELHASGRNAAELDALRQMASDPLDMEPDDLPASRRMVMTTTLRLLRDRRFGENVLKAYKHRCAMCGIQLRLLDAAHVLPVAHPDSNDQVTNGVALCALHHRSYDAALVTFDASYAIKLSAAVTADLRAKGRSGGLAGFRSALRPALIVPTRIASRPSAAMIGKANALRGWS